MRERRIRCKLNTVKSCKLFKKIGSLIKKCQLDQKPILALLHLISFNSTQIYLTLRYLWHLHSDRHYLRSASLQYRHGSRLYILRLALCIDP